MRRVAIWAGLAAIVGASFAIGATGDAARGPAADADRIAAGFRCPVCQGLSVKDSDSPTARNIRADIGRRLSAGETADEVQQAYVDRYGEWILLRPGASGFAALVWAVPSAAVAGGSVALGAAFWSWRRRGTARLPTDEEREMVAAAASRVSVEQPLP